MIKKFKRWRAHRRLQKVTEDAIVEAILKLPGVPLTAKVNRRMIKKAWRETMKEHLYDKATVPPSNKDLRSE